MSYVSYVSFSSSEPNCDTNISLALDSSDYIITACAGGPAPVIANSTISLSQGGGGLVEFNTAWFHQPLNICSLLSAQVSFHLKDDGIDDSTAGMICPLAFKATASCGDVTSILNGALYNTPAVPYLALCLNTSMSVPSFLVAACYDSSCPYHGGSFLDDITGLNSNPVDGAEIVVSLTRNSVSDSNASITYDHASDALPADLPWLRLTGGFVQSCTAYFGHTGALSDTAVIDSVLLRDGGQICTGRLPPLSALLCSPLLSFLLLSFSYIFDSQMLPVVCFCMFLYVFVCFCMFLCYACVVGFFLVFLFFLFSFFRWIEHTQPVLQVVLSRIALRQLHYQCVQQAIICWIAHVCWHVQLDTSPLIHNTAWVGCTISFSYSLFHFCFILPLSFLPFCLMDSSCARLMFLDGWIVVLPFLSVSVSVSISFGVVGIVFLVLIYIAAIPYCDQHDCENYGTCVSTTSTTWSCDCDPGYSGPNCEIQMSIDLFTVTAQYTAVASNLFYFIVAGGSNPASSTDFINSFTLYTANTLSTIVKEIFPTNVSTAFSAAVGGLAQPYFFIAGGLQQHGAQPYTPNETISIFDLESMSFLSPSSLDISLSIPRCLLIAVAVRDYVLFIDGSTGNDVGLENVVPSAVIDVYSPFPTPSISTYNDSEARVYFAACSVLDRYVVIAGGYGGAPAGPANVSLDSAYVFDASNVSFVFWPSALQRKRYLLGCAAMGSNVFFAGGTDDSGFRTQTLDIFHADSLSWSSADTFFPSPLTGPVLGIAVSATRLLFVDTANAAGYMVHEGSSNVVSLSITISSSTSLTTFGGLVKWDDTVLIPTPTNDPAYNNAAGIPVITLTPSHACVSQCAPRSFVASAKLSHARSGIALGASASGTTTYGITNGVFLVAPGCGESGNGNATNATTAGTATAAGEGGSGGKATADLFRIYPDGSAFWLQSLSMPSSCSPVVLGYDHYIFVANSNSNNNDNTKNVVVVNTTASPFPFAFPDWQLSVDRSSGHTGAACDGKFIVAGGRSGDDPDVYVGTMEIFDIYDVSSHLIVNLTARADAAAACVSGSGIFVMAGGVNSMTGYLSLAEIYNVHTGALTTVANALTQPRRLLTSAVLHKRYIFFAGGLGSDGTTTSDVVDVFDTQAYTWSVTIPLAQPRSLSAAVVGLSSIAFVWGSVDDSSSSNQISTMVDIYTITDNQTVRSSIRSAVQADVVAAAAVGVIGDTAFLAGQQMLTVIQLGNRVFLFVVLPLCLCVCFSCFMLVLFCSFLVVSCYLCVFSR